MHIVYIANIRLPTEKAHGLQIVKTCEALARQGAEIELVVPRRLNHLTDDPFVFYGCEKNFKITELPCWDLISKNLFGAVGFWIESWTFYRSVKKYLCKRSPETIYYTRDLSMIYWLSKIINPIFYEIHTLPEKSSQRHREAWSLCAGMVVISNGLKDELARQAIPLDKIIVARDAVDVNQFVIKDSREECRQKLGLPAQKKIIVYTGHLYEWKGAALLAQVAANFTSDIEVYLVGGTSGDVSKFRDVFHSLDNLHIVGWQEHRLMPFWHKAADVLVLPTSGKYIIGSHYTSPLKLFEYIVSGTPIVVPRLPAIQEILNEKQAFFFEPDNGLSLSKAINRALTLKQFKNITAVDARRFSWDERAKDIINFLSIRYLSLKSHKYESRQLL